MWRKFFQIWRLPDLRNKILLILALLAKAPADRPASAEAVARQLQAIAQSLRR